jgi:diguanylate cyclase (GGDEF)-like protein
MMTRRAVDIATSPISAGQRGASFDRAQFTARLGVVGLTALALALLPAAGPNGPWAALVVVCGAAPAHFVARRLTGVPNPTGWLDLIAVVTATVASAIEPTVWSPALLFQMLVLGGAVSFLPPRWVIALGAWSLTSMTVVAAAHQVSSAVGMLVVATIFLPVLVSGSVRKQARIKRTSLRMDAVADTLPMVVWESDRDAAGLTAVIGRTDELFGRSISEVIERGMHNDVHEQERTSYLRFLRDLARLDSGDHREVEYRYLRPDGTSVWLRDRAAVALSSHGWVIRGVTIDISEAKRRELDLHRHRQIVERMPALTIVIDHHRDDLDDLDSSGARNELGLLDIISSRVVTVIDPIGWGAEVDDTTPAGNTFGRTFPQLVAHGPLLNAMRHLHDSDVIQIGPWLLEDEQGVARAVEVEVFPLPGSTIALLVDDVTEREEMMSHVRHQARHDDLTGLLNRAALLQAATDAQSLGRTCTLLLIDLNDFKSINDTLGHLTGDHFLAVIAQRLDRLAHRHEYVTRLGGDEFAMLMVDASPGRVDELVEAVVGTCREPVTIDGVQLAGSASVGVATTSSAADTAEALLRCADLAMYHAKAHQAGASTYEPSMERSTDPLRLLGRLGRAFQDNEFVMHFQPKVDALTGKTIAFEALVRWEHPQLGILQPDAFLDLVAVSGHLDTLGAIAVRQAARALAQLPDDISVAVNVTAQNLRNLSFPMLCVDAFDAERVDLRRLIVEVTESQVLDVSGVTQSVIVELAELGVRVSVDDFGTGYSSLTHLRSLPLSEVKIDRRFVSALLTDEQDLVIVRSMIDLGHNLGLEVVAEGVEDAATMEMLRSLGCDVAQGYHLGRPAPLLSAIARCLDESAVDGAHTVESAVDLESAVDIDAEIDARS